MILAQQETYITLLIIYNLTSTYIEQPAKGARTQSASMLMVSNKKFETTNKEITIGNSCKTLMVFLRLFIFLF